MVTQSRCIGAIIRQWTASLSPPTGLYRERMGACLGFDPAARAVVRPNMKILVVDRLYNSGRHRINLREVIKLLRERYGGVASIAFNYMEVGGAGLLRCKGLVLALSAWRSAD